MSGSAPSNDRVGSRRMAGLTVAAMATILLASQAAKAEPIYWINAGTGDWADAANWDPSRHPLTNDDAYIRNNGTAQAAALGATAANVYVGQSGGAAGRLEVLPAGALTIGGSALDVAGRLTVSTDAAGSMTVAGGGTVSNSDGYLGFNTTGNGTATVDGAGSTWTNSAQLYIGRDGTGTLTVQNGGTLSNATGYLGLNGTADGTVTVKDAGSLWTNTTALYVGGSDTAAGGTALLTVQNSAVVNAGSVLKVWDHGTVNVTGGRLVAGGPAPAVDGSLTIGSDAPASLSIVGGGKVSNLNGYLGGYSTGTIATATVEGAGST